MMKIHSLLNQFNEMLVNHMLEDRHASSSCKHKWEKRMLDCQLLGYYCARCGKETLL